MFGPIDGQGVDTIVGEITMRTVKQVKREARYLFRLCLVNGSLDEHRVQQVIKGVLSAKRHGYLALENQFERLVRLERVRQSAEVLSETTSPDEVRINVEDNLVRMRGPGLNISFTERPALNGRRRVRAAS